MLKNILVHFSLYQPPTNLDTERAMITIPRRREVTWEEAVMEYKSYTKDIMNKDPHALKKQLEFLEKYKKLEKKK